ncbi:hypothetical protein [Nocardia seriolae]|uniref:Uncharacterized protein n=1 Tax=Nocardia seriolae TaxID=37332 RepID=A0A0B8NI15_9NOCA|nr:hypothetical protein [Nocardia seriolae]APA94837.1 hypothetical protein NS506_00758 [Nocardia seriolae]MTJ60130.1 hypothetical protein [Nocardia seriolae]MTJ76260.1 hypothetical protein [Nocardia seriolae]MTJ85129.1 hypothetical protein [Nocardia seriolae]MTK29123.1 hypothetical protein [Nocardia seriolae]
MEKTTILTANSYGAQFNIPGFVRIDEMRQTDEYGNAEFYVVFDDTKLGQVAQVTVSNSADVPPPAGQTPPPIVLGKVHTLGGWAYICYYASPAPTNWHNEKTMVVTGRAYNLEFYVPGFVAIDKIRQVDDRGTVQLYVRYNTTNVTQIHRISVTTIGPDRELPAGAVDLGLIHPYGSWQYVHYTDEIVSTQA